MLFACIIGLFVKILLHFLSGWRILYNNLIIINLLKELKRNTNENHAEWLENYQYNVCALKEASTGNIESLSLETFYLLTDRIKITM